MTTPQPPKPTTDPRSADGTGPAGRGSAGPGTAGTGPAGGPGVVKRTTNTFKRVLLVIIGALVALFAVFNSQNVEVNWIFGDAIQTPLILALAATFAAGIAIGWLWSKLSGRGSGNA